MPRRSRLASHAARMRSGAGPRRAGRTIVKRTLVRDHDLVAVPRQPRREHALGLAVAVHVGGVDERAAGVEEAVEDPVRLVDRRLAAHQHRAEGEAADRQRAERRRLHGAPR